MTHCRWEKHIDAYYDGEAPDRKGVEAHLASCNTCRDYLNSLETVRHFVQDAQAAYRPEIRDAQMPAFMRGIEAGLAEEAPAKSHKSLWAMLSLVTAALIMALATFSMFTGPGPVKATEIESLSTDLEGATVEWFDLDNGVTTVWINVSEEDVW